MESLFKHSGPIPGVSLSVALEWDLRICLSSSSQVDAVTGRGGGHTLRTTALGRRELNLVTPGFLNLSPTDILDWITVVEGYLVDYRMLSILGLYSMLITTCPSPKSIVIIKNVSRHSQVFQVGCGERQNHPRLRATDLVKFPFNEVMKPLPLVHKMQILFQMWSFLFNSSTHPSHYVSNTGGLLRLMNRSLLLLQLQLIEETVWTVGSGNCGDMEQGDTADFLKDYDKDGQELARQNGQGRKIPGRSHGGNKAWQSGNYQLFPIAGGNHHFCPV